MDGIKYGEIHVAALNATYMQIGADNDILRDLHDFFAFKVPGAQFSPKFKYGKWDGKIRLFKYVDQTLYTGLYQHLVRFASDRQFKVIAYDNILSTEDLNYEQYNAFINTLNIHAGGVKIDARDYQDGAIFHCIKQGRATVVSPTSSGKSLIIYSLCRWHQNHNRRVLMVVPTIQLVLQMYSDFKDYSSEIEWDVEQNVHKIHGGQDKTVKKPITVSTWQSLQNQKANFFLQYDAVIIDEVHTAKAAELTKILEKSTNAYYRHGFTGTLQKTECHTLTIQGLLGPSKKFISTKELMDKGFIAPLDIKCIHFKYNESDIKDMWRDVNAALRKAKKSGKGVGGAGYKAEIEFLLNHEERQKHLIALLLSLKNNTLVLYQFVDKHGKKIYNDLNALNEERNIRKEIYFISGGTPPEEREDIRRIMEQNDNIITVASYGTFSTGVNIPNIHNLVTAFPSKSQIKVLQSIGRALRKHSSKKKATLFDIVDDLNTTTKAGKTKKRNYAFAHFLERWKMYKEERFKIRIHERKLP